MRLHAAPPAGTAMMRAVSVALTILETTKQPSWSALAAEVRAEAPKVRASLLTLDIDPDTAVLLADQAAVVDLIRYGPGSGGRKPTTTTVLTCAVCSRWLIGVPTSGTPACVLTLGCTGKLVATKKATKVPPASAPANETVAAQTDLDPTDPPHVDSAQSDAERDAAATELLADPEPPSTEEPMAATDAATALDLEPDAGATAPTEPEREPPAAAWTLQPGDPTMFD